MIEPLFALTQSLLDEGISNGEFRDAPVALAPVVVAPVIAMMINILIFDNCDADELTKYMESHLDLVMNGLAVVRA